MEREMQAPEAIEGYVRLMRSTVAVLAQAISLAG
jgi:hypothetical protein